MKKGTLIRTNPYLKDSANREKGIARSVNSSSAIEGIHWTYVIKESADKNFQTNDPKPRKSSVTKKGRN